MLNNRNTCLNNAMQHILKYDPAAGNWVYMHRILCYISPYTHMVCGHSRDTTIRGRQNVVCSLSVFQYIILSNEANTKGQQDQSWNLLFMLWFHELDVTLWFKFHQHLHAEIKGPTTCCACRPALRSEYSKSFEDNKIKPSAREGWVDCLIFNSSQACIRSFRGV